MEERLMDDNKEMPNEEIPPASDQPAVAEEETDVAEEPAEEPAQQEAPSGNGEDPVLDSTEQPTPDMTEAPATAEEPTQESEQTSQGQEPPAENSEQPGEALVEMLDVAQPQAGEQTAEGAEVSTPPASGLEPPASEESPTLESVIEAILFATDEPLPEGKLAGIVETTGKQVRDCIESLNARYEANHNAFRIEQIAGGYQMLTQPIYNSWLKKMLRVRSDSKLSPAAMETLAIIAYKQPIIRADIEAIRGVAVGEVIRSLMYKGLVKIAGRAEILGRPMLYGTTKKFLEIFGLNSVKDLPKAEDLKNPDRG
jgi:segregation and condensation protein B